MSIAALVGADTQPSPWLSTASPTLQKEFDLSSSDTFPETIAGLGNQDCQTKTVITRPSKLFQSQLTASGCFVKTSFGIALSGLMQFGGAKVAGTMTPYSSYSGTIIVPNSLDFINYTSAGVNGLYLHFTRSIPGPISVDVASSGEVNYRFTQPASASLRDKAGNLMPAQIDSLGFSSNGEWMIVDSPNHAMLRVNVKTLDVLPFTTAFNYSIGIPPAAQTAISNDGRYAAVASKDFSVFTLYDLSTCSTVSTTISGPVSCQSRDLLSFMQSQLNGFIGAFNLRFNSDNILSLYGASNPGNGLKRAKFSLLAPGQTQDRVTYISLGDSFSSGEGENLGGTYYAPGTDEENNLCHLSTRSYPYLLRSDLGVSNFHSIACSGAEIRNIGGSEDKDKQYKDSSLTTELGIWMPGYQTQLEYINTTKPDFLTITIGGNDVGFANDIVECATSHYKIPLPNTCKYAGDPVERGNVAKRIADQYEPLKDLYEQLAITTNKKTKIYVVGYPQFIKGIGGSCGVNVALNDEERQFIVKATHYMDQVIKAAAEAAGAYYLDIENSLVGRNLCSTVSDPQMAVNGITEGNDKHLPWWAGLVASGGNSVAGGVVGVVATQRLGLGNESFHPNANGHLLMSQKILQLTDGDPGSFVFCPDSPNLVICPRGDSKIPLPDSAYFGSEAATYANAYNTVSATPLLQPPQPASLLINETALIPNQMHLHIDYLLPGTTVSIKTSGSSTSLGQYTTDTRGVFDKVVALPTDTNAGIQTVHVLGLNIAGEQRDYYQSIFIPGPINDLNGNGVLDNKESCGFITPSVSDVDMDDIDDACDGEIIQLPVVPKVTLEIRSLKAGN